MRKLLHSQMNSQQPIFPTLKPHLEKLLYNLSVVEFERQLQQDRPVLVPTLEMPNIINKKNK